MPYSAAGQICKFASLPEHCLNLAPQHYSSIAGYQHLAEMLTKLRARWGHWPEDDAPFLFAGGWAVTQGGSQWERRRWLHQLMLKKTRGSCLYSHFFGPLHLRQLPRSHLKMPKAFCGTDSASSVTWHRAHESIWVPGGTQLMTGPVPPPPCNHLPPWMLLGPCHIQGDSPASRVKGLRK